MLKIIVITVELSVKRYSKSNNIKLTFQCFDPSAYSFFFCIRGSAFLHPGTCLCTSGDMPLYIRGPAALHQGTCLLISSNLPSYIQGSAFVHPGTCPHTSGDLLPYLWRPSFVYLGICLCIWGPTFFTSGDLPSYIRGAAFVHPGSCFRISGEFGLIQFVSTAIYLMISWWSFNGEIHHPD